MTYKKWTIAVLASSMILTACGTKPEAQNPGEQPKQESPDQQKKAPADQVKAYKDIVAELAKGKDGNKIDFDKVEALYNDQFKQLVKERDSENNEEIDQQITSAIQAGKSGSMQTDIVKQIVDKLGQKVFFLTLRHEFKEVEGNITNKEKAKGDVQEAKTYYEGVLKSTVEKRDAAYGTQLSSAIDGAFNDMTTSVENGKLLDFSLAKQVVDKTMMKAFYLASGAEQGYAYKVEKAVIEGKDPKVEQSEGWAFYQSLYPYILKSAKEDAEFIQNKFDLKTSTKEITGDQINKAFVRGFASVAKSEYKSSFENFGKDKGVITALEGALFIQVIEGDAKKILGDAQTQTLLNKAGEFLQAAKANDKSKADTLYKEIQPMLDKLETTGK